MGLMLPSNYLNLFKKLGKCAKSQLNIGKIVLQNIKLAPSALYILISTFALVNRNSLDIHSITVKTEEVDSFIAQFGREMEGLRQ